MLGNYEPPFIVTKQGLIATGLYALEALVVKVDENIYPCYYVAENIHPWLLQHTCTVDSLQTAVYTSSSTY